MKKTNTYLVFVMIILLSVSNITAQNTNPQDSIYSLTIEDLMNMEISVASKNKTSIRESPGIVSVISADEIQKMGARDLIDILSTIPGFSFGTDVQGVVSVGIRGNWAHEGKISLQIDGMEVNEGLYSTIQLGRHFPVDNIKRIEIIRGPGSALYGGYAELGVVNIITKDIDDINGVAFSSSVSQMKETFGQQNLGISIGKKINDFDITLHSTVGVANRSEKDYTGFNTDYSGFTTYSMKDYSKINSMNLNLSINNHNFKNHLLIDQYSFKSKDGFDAITPAFIMKYNTLIWKSEYEYDISDKIKLTPELTYKKQSPWENNNLQSMPYGVFLGLNTQRITAKATFNINLTDKINLIAGLETYNDQANSSAMDSLDYFHSSNINDSSTYSISYNNIVAFAQGDIKTNFANFLVGARLENNSAVGTSFVPRIAATKAFDKLNFKILASQAFRSPGIMNIEANRVSRNYNLAGIDEIKPEKTTVLELEVGYKFTKNLFMSVNAFDITIDKPIIYKYDETYGIDVYYNERKTGTRGIEAILKYNNNWLNINATYSHYTQANKNEVDAYAVPDNYDKQALLGFARNKFTLNTNFTFIKNLSINPWLVYTGKKYGWTPQWDTSAGDAVWDVDNEFDPTLIFNVFINYNNLLIKKLSLGAGVYNILDQEINYVQPYLAWHAPIQGNSREFLVKLSYNVF